MIALARKVLYATGSFNNRLYIVSGSPLYLGLLSTISDFLFVLASLTGIEYSGIALEVTGILAADLNTDVAIFPARVDPVLLDPNGKLISKTSSTISNNDGNIKSFDLSFTSN